MKPEWIKSMRAFFMRACRAGETSLRVKTPRPAHFEEVSTTSREDGLLDTSFFLPWNANRSGLRRLSVYGLAAPFLSTLIGYVFFFRSAIHLSVLAAHR